MQWWRPDAVGGEVAATQRRGWRPCPPGRDKWTGNEIGGDAKDGDELKPASVMDVLTYRNRCFSGPNASCLADHASASPSNISLMRMKMPAQCSLKPHS